MTVRIIDRAAVATLLPIEDCIEVVRDALIAAAEGKALMPLRRIEALPMRGAMLGLMPGWLSEPPCFGVKATSVYPDNFERGLPSHQGVVLLFEPDSGRLAGIADGGEITAIRTAAASAAATDVLARDRTPVLALLGYGRQAWAHLEAMRVVRDIQRIVVWGRSAEKAAAFAARAAAVTGLEASAAADPASCVAEADIVCTVTASRDPVLLGRHVAPGTHVNLVGSSRATEAEADGELLARSRLFADYKPGVLAQGGEFLRAKEAGLIGEGHVLGEIGDVLAGRLVGRREATDITVFNSLGIVAEDLACAHRLMKRAEAAGLGLQVEM